MEESGGAGYDRRPLLVAALVVLALAAVGAFDYARTADRVPGVPGPGAGAGAFDARLDRAVELQNDLEVRAWAYGSAAFLAALAGVAVALRRNPRERWRDVFTDLGVGAVFWLLIAFGLDLAAGDGLVDVPSQPLYYPAIGLAVVAGAGTLSTHRAPAERAGEEDPTAVPAVRWLGLSATVAAVAFAWLAVSTGADPCAVGGNQDVETPVGLSLLAAAVAVVFGFASLFQRRWIAALVMLGVGPFAALIALIDSACLN
jgi:hypothetical protein